MLQHSLYNKVTGIQLILFGLYTDAVSNYTDKGGGGEASLAGTWISLLMNADDIVLIADPPKGMQRHLEVLQAYA